jgi:type I restriction enzyme S subunit
MSIRVNRWDGRFLYYSLLQNASRIKAASTGLIPGLSRSDILDQEIPLPPLPEQRAIAAALSDVDDLISALDKLIAKKRALKTATMQQLLTGKQRLPGFIGEWETRRLGEIASITMGRTPSRGVSSFWGSGYPWLSIADLKTKHLISTKEEITEAAVANMSVIPKGTLVMSFKLTIGKLAFASRDMYSNEAICGFNDLKADAEFVYYILGRTDFSLYGKQAVKGYTL